MQIGKQATDGKEIADMTLAEIQSIFEGLPIAFKRRPPKVYVLLEQEQ